MYRRPVDKQTRVEVLREVANNPKSESSSQLADFALGLANVQEIAEPQPATVAGNIPTWLNGKLYRIGPGTYDIKSKDGKTVSFAHWFDGLAVLHCFELDRGAVTYRNRHLNKDLEHYVEQKGRMPGVSMGEDPCGSLLWRAFSAFVTEVTPGRALGEYKDPATGKRGNANVNVTVGKYRGNKLVVRTDANVLVETDPVTLLQKPEMRYTEVMPDAKGVLAASHCVRDAAKGLTFQFVEDFPRGRGLFTVFCVPDDVAEEPYILAKIPVDEPVYMHSFAATERYLVLIVWPETMNAIKLLLTQNFCEATQWKPEKGVKFYVIDKRKHGPGVVATYTHGAFFCFHQVNAYDHDNSIIIDLIGYDNDAPLHTLYRTHMLFGGKQPTSTMRRYVLRDLDAAIAAGPDISSKAEGRIVTPLSRRVELPQINPAHHHKPYKYSYACTMLEDDGFFKGLAKVEMPEGRLTVWQEEGCYCSEPIFVASPGAKAEDDGVLLSVVLSAPDKKSFLVVLDAKNMKEVGRAWVSLAVPFNFHGAYLDQDTLASLQPTP
jgi:torulene dioxygenase